MDIIEFEIDVFSGLARGRLTAAPGNVALQTIIDDRQPRPHREGCTSFRRHRAHRQASTEAGAQPAPGRVGLREVVVNAVERIAGDLGLPE